MLRVAIVACAVVLAGVDGYLIHVLLAASHLTGLRISAPDGECWSGAEGTGASAVGLNVSDCGSTSFGLTCTSSVWADLKKSTPGNWTLSISGYSDGRSLGTDSVVGNLGVVRHIFVC